MALERYNLPKPSYIYPDWPAPSNIKAFSTCRFGGFSLPPFDSFNMGQHVGDNPLLVDKNRQLLPNSQNFTWLKQIHGSVCLDLDNIDLKVNLKADACFSKTSHRVCAVMTADCLPILLCDESGTSVAAIHAGWRGLADGVIENTVSKIALSSEKLLAWMGPAISQDQFEVGHDVKEVFKDFPHAIKKNELSGEDKYFVNLYQIASDKMRLLGINQIYGGQYCTYQQQNLFFSHRRVTKQAKLDPSIHPSLPITTGRMVTAIYIQ